MRKVKTISQILKALSFSLVILSFVLYVSSYSAPIFAQAPSPLPLDKDFALGDIKTLGEGTTRLMRPIFSIATLLVVIYFLLAAFKYMKAGANKEDVEGAKQMITHSLIGFVLLMFAFLILQFLLATLFNTTAFKLIG